MTVKPLGQEQGCNLMFREPDVPVPWFLDPRGWSKTAAVSLYFIFPGICTLSFSPERCDIAKAMESHKVELTLIPVLVGALSESKEQEFRKLFSK
ncbi:hypothetical protein STEG23_004360 [Scotinomys teguina]